MKRLLVGIALAVAILLLYGWLSGEAPPARTSLTARPPVVTAAPTSLPAPTAQPTPAPFVRPPAPRTGQPVAGAATQQAHRMIYQCAQRSQYRIIRLEPQGPHAARVTGVGDNARAQQFISEIERALRLIDIQGPLDPAPVPDPPGWVRSTFFIRWR